MTAIRPETLERIDHYFSQVLACPVERARAGGVHLVSEPRRALPGWLGYLYVLVALAFDGQGAAIAARPRLAPDLIEAMGSDLLSGQLDSSAMRRLSRRMSALLPHAFTLGGDVRIIDQHLFRPPSLKWEVDQVPLDDPRATDLRRRFDGPIFAVRAPEGALASWAALKLKSEDVWEIAVATQPEYRGRGMAREVVASATQYSLARGRLCLYIHDRENRSSAYVSRSLGFERYAEIVISEF